MKGLVKGCVKRVGERVVVEKMEVCADEWSDG